MQAEAPRFQVRVPLRLRGLLLLKLKPDDGLEQIEKAPPLGAATRTSSGRCRTGPGHLVRCAGQRRSLEPPTIAWRSTRAAATQVHAAVASAEGDTAIELLRACMEREGWRAYAPKAGVFIEPDALDLFALPDDCAATTRGSELETRRTRD